MLFNKKINAEKFVSYAEEKATYDAIQGMCEALLYLIEEEDDISVRGELECICEEVAYIGDKKRREQKRLKQYKTVGYNYITRDLDGSITFFENEPKKTRGFFWSVNSDLPGSNLVYPYGKDSSFKNVKWDDEKPTKIANVILDNSWRGF